MSKSLIASIARSLLRMFFLTFVVMSSPLQATVAFSDPPVDFTGPRLFDGVVLTNVRLVSGTATIAAGAKLDGYFWGTGGSTTEWTGGSVATYLQADAFATIVVRGSGLVITGVGPWFTGEQYRITGTLLSGQPIDIDAYTYSGGSFSVQNVPEVAPHLMLLLGIPLVTLASRRSQSTR